MSQKITQQHPVYVAVLDVLEFLPPTDIVVLFKICPLLENVYFVVFCNIIIFLQVTGTVTSSRVFPRAPTALLTVISPH